MKKILLIAVSAIAATATTEINAAKPHSLGGSVSTQCTDQSQPNNLDVVTRAFVLPDVPAKIVEIPTVAASQCATVETLPITSHPVTMINIAEHDGL